MKKDIVVIRESIKKIVALMTMNSISVTQRGIKAYVEYDSRTGAIKRVNIPNIPDGADENFIAVTQGFLDHEVGHVLFTNPKVVIQAQKMGPRVKKLANIVEDVFVERKMINAFRGSLQNLDSVRRFHVDSMALPKIKAHIAAGEVQQAAGYLPPIQFRAWGGQTVAQEFLKDNPEIAKLGEELERAIGPELIAKVGLQKNSEDCLKLAIEIERKIAPRKSPPMKSEDGADKDSGGSLDESKGSSSEGEDKSDGEKDETPPEDKGTKTTEEDDSGKKREESSKTDEAAESGGEVEGDEEPTRSAEDEPDAKDPAENSGDEPDESAADSDGTEDSRGDESESETTKSSGEDEAAGEDEAGAGARSKGDDDDDTGAEGEEASGEEGTGAKDDDGAKSDTSGENVDDEGGDTKGGEDSADRDYGKALDGDADGDFDKEVGELLSKMAGFAMRDSEYKVYSTDWDSVYEAPKAIKESSIEKMVEKVSPMVSVIQKQLERSMAAKDKKTWNPGQRRGRISPGALFRTATGDDRVFRQRHDTRAINTAVSLMVDCSGSMGISDRIGIAGMAAYALSSTLDRLKITHEVIGYTTEDVRAMGRSMSSEDRGVRYARTEALRMPVFKGFQEKLGTNAKSRMAHLTENPRWIRENVDGECLQIAAHRLLTQKAERHVLIVLSDGEPACPGDYTALTRHLSGVVESIEKRGVEVIGIGIQSKSVSKFYRNSLVLNKLEDLPTTLVTQLSKILLAPQK